MKKIMLIAFGALALTMLVLVIIPSTRDEIHWFWVSHNNEPKDYFSYFQTWPSGRHVTEAKLRHASMEEFVWKKARLANASDLYQTYFLYYPNGQHSQEAIARSQITAFQSGFKNTHDFTDEQVKDYISQIENETQSLHLYKPLEYFLIQGDHPSITKERVVVEPGNVRRACLLQLKAGGLSVTAIYVDVNSGVPISRALFMEKYEPTMTHTSGTGGPGVEFNMTAERHMEFKQFLDTYSISYRTLYYNDGGGVAAYVVADLLWKSDIDGSPHPHLGARESILEEYNPLFFSVDGIEGIPNVKIDSYKQALALKTYLAIFRGSKP